MKYFLIIGLVVLFGSCKSQSISGTFSGDRIKNFRFSEKYWYVDGFGSYKMIGIEYTKNGMLSSYKFKSNRYTSWFDTFEGKTFLVIENSKCNGKLWKFQIKKMKNNLIR